MPFQSGWTRAAVLLTFTGIACIDACAQHYIGIEGGCSRIWERQVERPGGRPYEVLEIRALSSGVVKVTYDGALSRIAGLHAAAGYGEIGSRNGFPNRSTDYIKRRFRVLYAETAMTGRTNTLPIQLVGRLGLRFGYAFDLSEALVRNGVAVVESHSDESINRMHASVIMAAGVAWNLSHDMRILAMGEYSNGFTSLWREGLFTGDEFVDRYPHSISMLIGLQLRL